MQAFCRHNVIALLVLALSLGTSSTGIMMAHAQDTTDSTDSSSPPVASSEQQQADPATTTTTTPEDTFNVKEHMDWGTYYDPKNIFCGKYDCYRILGFDYESYGKEKPNTKLITKRYRALSREWHPDKSKHKDAKERFVKIARAYEVLTNFESRKEYDMMRYDQEAYFQKYGSNVIWQFAPKSDTAIVILFVLLFVNGFGWFAQYQRWRGVADRLARAAIEDWSPAQGGTTESKDLRDHALEVLAEREKEAAEKDSGNADAAKDKTASKAQSKKSAKAASSQPRKRNKSKRTT